MSEQSKEYRTAICPVPALLVVLSTLWPNAHWLNTNKWNLPTDHFILNTIIVFIGALILGVLASGLSRFIPPRVHRNYWMAASLTCALLFSWDALAPIRNYWSSNEDYRYLPGIVMLLAFALLIMSAWWLGGKRQALPAAFLFFGTALAIPVTTICIDVVSREYQVEFQEHVSSVPATRYRPNVYVFVVDGYARQDILAQEFGFDNEPFLHDLESRGYKVQRNSTANYPVTYLSLASTLDMNYVQTPDSEKYADRKKFYEIIAGNSKTARRFRAHGYKIAQVNFANAGCSLVVVDRCLGEPVKPIGRSLQSIVELTPIRHFLRHPRPILLGAYNDELKSLQKSGPIFTFVHTLPPHPPYEYNERCEYHGSPGDDPRSIKTVPQYVGMVKCVNENILKTIRLIEDIDRRAIVIFISDHGSFLLQNMALPFTQWTTGQIYERFANFSAIRLPPECSGMPIPRSLVNMMETVFACIESRHPTLQADRYFIGAYENNPDYGLVREIGSPYKTQ